MLPPAVRLLVTKSRGQEQTLVTQDREATARGPLGREEREDREEREEREEREGREGVGKKWSFTFREGPVPGSRRGTSPWQ